MVRPVLPARLNPAEFLRGISYAVRGVRILRKYPELARYWLVPIALSLLSLLLSVFLALRYHDDLLALLWQMPEGAGLTSAILRGLYWLARGLAFALSLAGLVLLCVVLTTLVAAPFNDALSEAIEVRETGRAAPTFTFRRLFADLVRTLRVELAKLLVFAALMTPLTIFSWVVPGVGHAALGVVGGLFTAIYFAVDYIDWPASRRGLGVRERLSLFSRRPWLMLGFGMAVWACLFVPILNVAFMPIAVAGGTRLFLDLESELHR